MKKIYSKPSIEIVILEAQPLLQVSSLDGLNDFNWGNPDFGR